MTEQGWIKLDRKILSWGWYGDPNTFRVFLHLLLIANYGESVYHGVKVRRGQAVTGRKALAEALNISEQNVRTALKHLKSTGEITITRYSHFSLISLVNYDTYQTNQPTLKPSTNHIERKKRNKKEVDRPADEGGPEWEQGIPERFRGRFRSFADYRAWCNGEEYQ